MFKRLEGDTAVVVIGGVYKQVDLYERDGKLFAATAGGYVRINVNGTTSKDKLSIDTLVTEAPLFKDQFGRLCTVGGEGRKELLPDESRPLLLPPGE